MAEDINDTTQDTAELLRDFHEETKKRPKQTHADNVLSVCSIIYIIVGCIGSFVAFDGFTCLAAAFGVFTTGVFMYVVAQIYKNVRELNEK